MQWIINTIRADQVVGRGSCSLFDEAYTDQELVEYFTSCECKTPDDVLKLAYRVHSAFISMESN